jgi:hypothetical protein
MNGNRASIEARKSALKKCKRIVTHVMRIAEVADSLENPQIPEVLVNPHFLVVPKFGSLVTIDVQSMPDTNPWEFTLAKIEDLFEIKMSAGTQTVVSLILFEWERSESKHDAIKLLGRMFDQVLVVSFGDDLERTVTRFVRELIGNPVSREDLNYLWELEYQARQSNFEKISSLSYVQKILAVHQEFESKLPRQKNVIKENDIEYVQTLEVPIYEKLLVEPSYWLQDRVRVMNMKQFLIGSLTNYYFTFDFAFSPSSKNNQYLHYFGSYDLDYLFESGGGFCEFIAGSKGTFGRKSLLRKLATYSRFINYVPDDAGEKLQLRKNQPRLYLLIDGSMFGPDYAPNRYLHMLIQAGWRPMHVSDFSKEALMEGS